MSSIEYICVQLLFSISLLRQVRSSTQVTQYQVDLDAFNPRCTCKAWVKSELPCKHIFAILLNTGLEWHDFPESFRCFIYNLSCTSYEVLANTKIDATILLLHCFHLLSGFTPFLQSIETSCRCAMPVIRHHRLCAPMIT